MLFYFVFIYYYIEILIAINNNFTQIGLLMKDLYLNEYTTKNMYK